MALHSGKNEAVDHILATIHIRATTHIFTTATSHVTTNDHSTVWPPSRYGRQSVLNDRSTGTQNRIPLSSAVLIGCHNNGEYDISGHSVMAAIIFAATQ
jgi:hypothetical protein